MLLMPSITSRRHCVNTHARCAHVSPRVVSSLLGSLASGKHNPNVPPSAGGLLQASQSAGAVVRTTTAGLSAVNWRPSGARSVNNASIIPGCYASSQALPGLLLVVTSSLFLASRHAAVHNIIINNVKCVGRQPTGFVNNK